jgi:Ca2+-dependent lipid-binding protein
MTSVAKSMQQHVLHVHILGADNLKKVDTDEGAWADPYCVVYANGTKIGKTSTKKKTKKPEWKKIMKINVDDGLVHLRFEVFDWDSMLSGGKHTFLGMAAFSRDEIIALSNKHNLTFKLQTNPEKLEDYNINVQGELKLSFSIMANEDKINSEHVAAVQTKLKETTKNQILHLHVIKACIESKNSDYSMRIFADDLKVGTTRAKRKTVEPQWDEVFDIDLHNGPARLRLVLIDWKLEVGGVPVGLLLLNPLDALQYCGKYNCKFKLSSVTGEDGIIRSVEGSIFLSFSVMSYEDAGKDAFQQKKEVKETVSLKRTIDPLLVSTEHQMLHVHVLRADNIKKVDKEGWADPYCIVYANEKRLGKTGTKKRAKAPVWNKSFSTSLHEGHVHLRIEVFDWNSLTSGDEHNFLGMVNVDATKVTGYYNKHNVKFALQRNSEESSEYNRDVQGDLFLSFSVMTNDATYRVMSEQLGIKYTKGIHAQSIQQKMLENSAHMILHVHVIGANDIEQCDETGWSDPYIVVTSNEMEVGKTAVKMKTKSPRWHEIFDVDLSGGPMPLKFVMFDWDREAEHTFMGIVEFDADTLYSNFGMSNVCFPFTRDENRNALENLKVGGTLMLSFSVMMDKGTRALEEEKYSKDLGSLKGLHQTLHLHICSANNLQRVDDDSWADPYCVVYVNEKKVGKTKTKKNTKNPVWNQPFEVRLLDQNVDLRMEVFDWDSISTGGRHTFLGLVEIHADDLAEHYNKHNIKFALQKDLKKSSAYNEGVGGELFLSIGLSIDEAARLSHISENGSSPLLEESMLVKTFEQQLKENTDHQILHLHIVGAENVQQCDETGWSDPYIIIYVNNKKFGKTTVKMKTKEPRWNEVFEVDLNHGHAHLRFEMYDWDRGGDHTFMGLVEVDADSIKSKYGKQNIRLQLVPDHHRTHEENVKVGGHLLLSFVVMTDEVARLAEIQEEKKRLAAEIEEQRRGAALTALYQENRLGVRYQSASWYLDMEEDVRGVQFADLSERKALLDEEIHEAMLIVAKKTAKSVDEPVIQDDAGSVADDTVMNASPSSFEGFLWTAENSANHWRKRYFVHEHNELAIKKTKHSTGLAWALHIEESMQIFPTPDESLSLQQKTSFGFRLHDVQNGIFYHLCAMSEADRTMWCKILEQTIQSKNASTTAVIESKATTDHEALSALAIEKLSVKEIRGLKKGFNLIDLDGSGSIDESELATLMEMLNIDMPSDKLRELIAVVDIDGSGELDFDEFLVVAAKAKKSGEYSTAFKAIVAAAAPRLTIDSIVIDDVGGVGEITKHIINKNPIPQNFPPHPRSFEFEESFCYSDAFDFRAPAEKRDHCVHALFQQAEVMLPHLEQLYKMPLNMVIQRRQTQREEVQMGKSCIMDIIDRRSGQFVGLAGFIAVVGAEKDKNAEFNIVVSKARQRQGILTEAWYCNLLYAMDELKCHTVSATTSLANEAMVSFLTKQGMKRATANDDQEEAMTVADLLADDDPKSYVSFHGTINEILPSRSLLIQHCVHVKTETLY